MRRLGAVLLVLALGTARAEAPAVKLELDPYKVYGPLVWKGPKLTLRGFWYTEAQVTKIDQRITFLEEKAAKECVDAQVAMAKKVAPWVKVVAGVLVGATVGFCVGREGHCGIGGK